MTKTTITITVEPIGDVPELASVRRRVDDHDLHIVERRDGKFVRRHGDPRANTIWDDARHIAERIEARYVGPGRAKIRSAREIRAGWYVLVGSFPRERWHRVKDVREVVNLATLRETSQPRPKIRIKFDHCSPLTVAPDEQLDCRQPSEALPGESQR